MKKMGNQKRLDNIEYDSMVIKHQLKRLNMIKTDEEYIKELEHKNKRLEDEKRNLLQQLNEIKSK